MKSSQNVNFSFLNSTGKSQESRSNIFDINKTSVTETFKERALISESVIPEIQIKSCTKIKKKAR